MTATLNRTSRIMGMALLCGFLLAIASQAGTMAQPATPIVEATFPPFPAGEDDTIDTLLLNFMEEDGGNVVFPAGQEICLDVTIRPSLTGPGPFATPCYTGTPRDSIWGGRPENPFLTTSSYSITIASNETVCTFASLSMETADYGAGGTHAIINVTVSCPDFEVPDPDTYEELRLRFANRGAPETLPGEICVSIVADPPLDRGPLNSCTTLAENADFWVGSAAEPLPPSSTYTTTVTSNDTGCSVIVNPLTEFTNTFGNIFGTIVVDIDCGPPWSDLNYSSLRIVYTNDGTAPATLTGPICVQVDTNPLGGLETPQVCGDQSDRLYSKPSTSAYPLPRSSTYVASVYRNDSGCWALPQALRALPFGPVEYVAEIIVLIGCGAEPAPTIPPVPTATTVAPTSESTLVPDPTTMPTEGGAATESSLPTETIVTTGSTSTVVVPDSTTTPASTTGPIWTVVPDPSGGATSTIPSVDPSPAPAAIIIGLPNTGTGSSGMGNSLALMLAGIWFIALGVGSIRQKRQRVH